MADPHGLMEAALADLHGDWVAHPAGGPVTGRWSDTVAAAAAMRDKGCAVVVTLGGDGTNRAAVLGWPDLPVVAVSTGTNNAFPAPGRPDGGRGGRRAGLVGGGRPGRGGRAGRGARPGRGRPDRPGAGRRRPGRHPLRGLRCHLGPRLAGRRRGRAARPGGHGDGGAGRVGRRGPTARRCAGSGRPAACCAPRWWPGGL